ncbi:ribonuclease P complex subunit Pop1 [Drechmeria coniospora]|uniref:Ribonuclease P complex subunit Pop1 n=1 Tax=Drechmeria coniospora TaxID=98403 RepID=A0A151GS37_DRECN|nr:ribonuclease P complex subunit Pop1 [Drechmeria coniospora]KYK59888.1 ribonuclease P complex subunit Pop1 [Drechmeria coniospora]
MASRSAGGRGVGGGGGGGGGQAANAHRHKRAKLNTARNIPIQPADAALKDGELDLQAFVAAHEFEIKSLEQSMSTSKAVSTGRAFQMVPRGLRRRTASHNPKKVPRRLRARARREMAEDNTPTVESRRRKPRTVRARIRAETAKRLGILARRQRIRRRKLVEAARAEGEELPTQIRTVVGRLPRPKIRRNELNDPPKPTARFRRRQINKTWLPTHLWHAKRARMTEPKKPLWRFAIPLTPNEKIYRPTHRAQGERGTMVWDMSYVSTIGLYGNPVGIERVLRRVGLSQDSCWNDKGGKWKRGARTWSGLLSRGGNGQRRHVCPATVIWNPESPGSNPEQQATVQRQVYLRVHPSAFLELFNELLRWTKMETPRLYIEDLRFEIGAIDLTGPASTEALLATLAPHAAGHGLESAHAKLFESLQGLTNPAALPANSILHFSIQDPRLRYPPRKQVLPDDPDSQLALLQTMQSWPAEDGLEPSALFDRDARHRASCLPSQKSIDRRKGSMTAGRFLDVTKADPPIPVVLFSSRSASSIQSQGTWTLLAPWKCILPIWHSLVHVPLISGLNPRPGGLKETVQVAFERGQPWFPADYLATDAGADWELEQRCQRKTAWGRRPKSKRTEWMTVHLGAGRRGELGDGLSCDFEMLFGLPGPPKDENDKDGDAVDASVDGMNLDQEVPALGPVKGRTEPSGLKLLNQTPKATFDHLVASPSPMAPGIPNAILQVRICLVARGVVTTCARIYRLPSAPISAPTTSSAEVPATLPPAEGEGHVAALPHDLRSQWLARLPSHATHSAASKRPWEARHADPIYLQRERALAQSILRGPAPSAINPPPPNHGDIGGHPLVPDAKDLVGFVTSGSFCLANGRAVAIGSLALDKVLPDVRANSKEGRLCIVRNAGESVGWLARWEAV